MATDNLENLPGVGPATAEKFQEEGYDTFLAVASENPGKLANKVDVGEKTAEKAVAAAQDAADVGDFRGADDILEKRKNMGKVSLKVKEFDDLIGGGIELGAITEFYGEFGSGKSQFTHQIAVNTQLPPEFGGVNGRVVFIDTEASFRPERIDQMVRGLSDEAIAACMERDGVSSISELVEVFLSRISVADAFNSNHQILLGKKATEFAKEHVDSDMPVKMLMVDSITGHFRAEYVGRGKLSERQQKLNEHIYDIKRFIDLYDVGVIFANQVSSNPDSYFGDPTKAIGGNILGHASTFRIYIRKSSKNSRVCKLVDAPAHPDGEAPVVIEGDGIREK